MSAEDATKTQPCAPTGRDHERQERDEDATISAKDVKHAVDHYAAVYEKFGQLDATLVVDGRIGNLCRECK